MTFKHLDLLHLLHTSKTLSLPICLIFITTSPLRPLSLSSSSSILLIVPSGRGRSFSCSSPLWNLLPPDQGWISAWAYRARAQGAKSQGGLETQASIFPFSYCIKTTLLTSVFKNPKIWENPNPQQNMVSNSWGKP